MPWKLLNINADGQEKIITEGKAWTGDDGTQHPSNWAIWSDDEKKAKGLTWEDPPKTYDKRFYWDVGIEKNLADSSDGTIGLKTQWINSTKDKANSLLQLSDWYVTRKAEKSTEIPSDITKHRNDIRTACNTIETKIKAASDMSTFIKLFDSADSNGMTDINRWPEEV
tara:strand:- start:1105 stop:1608 length:504 start_codon:yes stop_codon:yes gene_type:complete